MGGKNEQSTDLTNFTNFYAFLFNEQTGRRFAGFPIVGRVFGLCQPKTFGKFKNKRKALNVSGVWNALRLLSFPFILSSVSRAAFSLHSRDFRLQETSGLDKHDLFVLDGLPIDHKLITGTYDRRSM